MRNLSKNILGLCLVGMGLGVGAPTQAATGVGPYYAMPSWDQTLPAATRFIVLTNMNSEAVLDRETGLVWELSPSGSSVNWKDATFHCIDTAKGGRKGWRLPTLQEIMSLIDPTQSTPALPSGHPFRGVIVGAGYWSATTLVSDAILAWSVVFNAGDAVPLPKNDPFVFTWCVRGGQGPDTQ